jgi:hypothetical protein
MTRLYQSCLWVLRSVAVLCLRGDLAAIRPTWIILDFLHSLALLSCPAAFLFCLVAILCTWSPPAPHPGDLKNVES